MSTDKNLQEKASEALKKAGVGAATAADFATTPPKTNKHASTTRNTWQNIKNLVSRVRSSDEWSPFKSRVGRIQNTPSERARGNDVSASYGQSGKLTLTIANYVFNDDALKILDAVDSSEEKRLDPKSSALGVNFSSDTLIDVKGMMKNQGAMKGYEKLVALREHLAKFGGEISVARTRDGFERTLKVTLDTENKTVDQIQKEIESVLECVGIKNRTLAHSLAKEMAYKRDMGHSQTGDQVSNIKNDGSARSGSDATGPSSQTAQHGHNVESDVDSNAQHSVDSSGSEVGDDMVLGLSAAQQSGAGPGDITPESFSLAATVGPYARSQIGGESGAKETAELQSEFLKKCSGAAASQDISNATADITLDEALVHSASAGLDGVVNSGVSQSEAASFTPTSAPGQATASARAVSTGRDA
ncbi:AM410 family tick-upregulated protein [Anaplasma marginale]|uniref:AM410 family tick-upregulated protein n=1 Tax=Anaplasma marginale TaxID=770 RepID=UPI00123A6AFE|nr:hypothetical protein [Anaplasma marginale]KAA8473098.1 hypothetical protein F0Q58_00345 [Anaplasma marginale]KAB0451458.1 hypothetical protein FY210_00345 [Anaplasma marginale]